MLNRIKKCFFSNINISTLLTKKAILLENVNRENCKKDLIIKFFKIKGYDLHEDNIHIMRNVLTRPTGRIMILTEDLKKQNFNFDFNNEKNENINDVNEINMKNENKDSKNNLESKYYFEVKDIFKQCKIHLCDDYEVEKFVEECERFIRFTEDIKRIAKIENINKIVTIINVPNCYGRNELYSIIYEATKVKVKLNNIIFRFKKNGTQSDTAYILCNSLKDTNLIIHKIQEYPVAKKYHLKEFYGASFLYASRNNLFLCYEQLDYIINFSKYKVFTCGWYNDISIKEFEDFLITLKIFPYKIIKAVYNNIDNLKKMENNINSVDKMNVTKENNEIMKTNENHIYIYINDISYNNTYTSDNEERKKKNIEEDYQNTAFFILFFENMRMTKKVFTKLERLKKKWKILTTNNFYAYPKIPDIHFDDESTYSDENEYEDSDIDEEIEY